MSHMNRLYCPKKLQNFEKIYNLLFLIRKKFR